MYLILSFLEKVGRNVAGLALTLGNFCRCHSLQWLGKVVTFPASPQCLTILPCLHPGE